MSTERRLRTIRPWATAARGRAATRLLALLLAGLSLNPAARAGTIDVTLTASPTDGLVGQTVTLGWSAPGAVACTAAGGTVGDGWTGSALGASGRLAVSEAAAGPVTYSLSCAGGSGSSGEGAVTVSWSPAPTVTLAAPSLSVGPAATVPLSWVGTSVTACVASSEPVGLFSGDVPATGSMNVSSGAGPSATYTVRCAGVPEGSASGDLTVTVVPAPTVTLSASTSQVTAGGSLTLAWATTGALTCTAGGGTDGDGWSGSQALSGQASVRESAPGTRTYTLACTGAGGTGTGSAAVTVVAASGSGGTGGGGGVDVATLTLLGLPALLTGRRRRPR